jgi:hypothetical protein
MLDIMRRYRDKRPPSSPDMEPRAAMLDITQISGTKGRPPAPMMEPEGGHVSSFVAIIRRYRDKRAALQPHDGSQRAAR